MEMNNQLRHETELRTADGEDCIFRQDDGWYWQTSGTSDVFGPFATAVDAARDNDRPLSDFEEGESDGDDYTYQCDADHCDHETIVRHERGVGVYCGGCREKRIDNSWNPELEKQDQERTLAEQLKTVPQN